MILENSSYNPLWVLLNYFPKKHSIIITYEDLDVIRNILRFGGVVCENSNEVCTCLSILEELNLISINKVKTDAGLALEVRKIYSER